MCVTSKNLSCHAGWGMLETFSAHTCWLITHDRSISDLINNYLCELNIRMHN